MAVIAICKLRQSLELPKLLRHMAMIDMVAVLQMLVRLLLPVAAHLHLALRLRRQR